MRKLLLIVLLLLSPGCASMMDSGTGREAHQLDMAWRPLLTISERPRVVRDLGSDTAITTVGKHCYVRDLEEWLGRYPIDSGKFKAVMRHEQEHSIRQLEVGTYLWIARYSYDKEFALLEEQIGYYYGITQRRRFGVRVSAESFARILSRYKILTGSLISYEDALSWVRDVLGGRWLPPTQ